MLPSFKIAELSDLDSLIEMVRAYHEYDHLAFDRDSILSVLEHLIQTPALGRAWLIQSSQQTIGYAFLTFGYSVEYGGRNAFVDELYLQSEYRGKGFGHHALEFLKNTARELGVKALHLEVERNNDRALHLYRKIGFQDPDRVLMTYWTASSP